MFKRLSKVKWYGELIYYLIVCEMNWEGRFSLIRRKKRKKRIITLIIQEGLVVELAKFKIYISIYIFI